MLKIEVISASAMKITAPKKLRADDFLQIAPQIDSLISLLIPIDVAHDNGMMSPAVTE